MKRSPKKISPLHYKKLRKILNLRKLSFDSTLDIECLSDFIGQRRALEALHFGIGIKSHGYNLFAMGPSGIGKRSLILIVLNDLAKKQNPPTDWCYIHNFENPARPLALALPPGTGSILQQDMKTFISELSSIILTVFESNEYRFGMQKIEDEFNKRRHKFENKTSAKKKTKTNEYKIPRLYKERHEKEKALELKFTTSAVEPLILKLKEKYANFPQVLNHLSAIQKDIIERVTELIKIDETTNLILFNIENPVLIKYQVNLLVDNKNQVGAPVIFEENPSYSNLICRVEHEPQQGSMVTNFTLIKAGSILKANGGYLVIESRKLKKNREAWEGLKRALTTHEVRIEPIESLTDHIRPVSLDPFPIPLDIKIILIGERGGFYSLINHDQDFGDLFKVVVDFAEQIDRTDENIGLYARMIKTIALKEGLLPFHAGAIAEVIDHSTRLAEDIEKLSTHVRSIVDLSVEANYWANLKNKKMVESEDVKYAIQAQIHRLDRTRELYYEDIKRNFILIDTEDHAIGQVNCLSVVKVGKFSYGHPTRVTAKVRMGRGKIIDIQREIKLAGPSMTKGGLIISNFIAGRYNVDDYFCLHASLSFEQIYGSMDGDSASVAELCALLSALADVPIKQYLAITGSTNQYGEVQCVGGINAKVEGFYDVCKDKGLTGKQGVLLPAVNVENLMLREDIVLAAKAKKFSIYPFNQVDEAIFLLTGMTAGVRNSNGEFTKNSINYRVEKRLQEFSRKHSLKKTKRRK